MARLSAVVLDPVRLGLSNAHAIPSAAMSATGASGEMSKSIAEGRRVVAMTPARPNAAVLDFYERAA